ncbi:MAG TPA: FHA domain-containing protein [Planctomycetaceae bacterium]|nr:FHA domain-containing protein [Planctomycetaceae bacterium]
MANITIRVLEGLERGRVFADLVTPITIGREDDNDIQLNDDRTSRFHAKLQDDGGQVILTDLESTNGTRVNGHPVQMKVLQPGDLVAIGRCVLLFGDPPGWNVDADDDPRATGQTAVFDSGVDIGTGDVDFLSPPMLHNDRENLFPSGAPPVPTDLRPLQLAQVSDILAYLHDRLGSVVAEAAENDDRTGADREICCPWEAWQRLVAAQSALAAYLRKLAEPD